MLFEVMNREDAECFAMKSHSTTSVVIAITNYKGVDSDIPVTDTNKILDVLHLQFDDCLTDLEGHTICEEDAKSICAFFYKWKDTVDKLIVHCDGGVSRSSGVCAALAFLHQHDDMFIWENAKYTPNCLCYKTVLKEGMGSSDLDICAMTKEKDAINEKAWLAASMYLWYLCMYSRIFAFM